MSRRRAARSRERRIPSGRLVAVILGTGAVCGLTVVLGVLPPFVIAATVLTAAAGCAWLGLRVADPAPLPRENPDARPGTRSDVAWLTWSLSTRGRGLEGQARERVRRPIRQRFARRGLDPDDPTARVELERLLGPASWAFVSGEDSRPATIPVVEHCLDVLDGLPVEERGRVRP